MEEGEEEEEYVMGTAVDGAVDGGAGATRKTAGEAAPLRRNPAGAVERGEKVLGLSYLVK